MIGEQKCRVCGCVQERACVTKDGPCSWIEADLCSACAGEEYRKNGFKPDAASLEIMQGVVPVALSVGEWVTLISIIQLASRHPGAKDGPAMEFGMNFSKFLQSELGLTPQIAFVLQQGWDQVNDVTSQPEQSRIIIPGR